MKIVVIGKNGQLAHELQQLDSSLICLGREDINLFDYDSMEHILVTYKPDAIINASAYTAVDKAESEQEEAFLLNHKAVEHLTYYCEKTDCHLVHVSTDYVFSGDKGEPYLVDDPHAPLGVYGASKAAGESVIMSKIADNSCIIRTSWVYSRHGGNFVKTMLRLMAEKPELSVIDDQVGSPTSAAGLASICKYAAEYRVSGIHHYTDAGVASWYDFAVAIQRIGLDLGLLSKVISIYPIPTSAYPTPAKRPTYSVLSKSTLKSSFAGLQPKHWQIELESVISNLSKQNKSE
jgi:dTDP-4-dehydrorhamnose reductase